MEIDEVSESECVPTNLHRFSLFNCRVCTSKTQYTDLMLTKGPILYEMKSKHILTSCDLSNTVFKGNIVSYFCDVYSQIIFSHSIDCAPPPSSPTSIRTLYYLHIFSEKTMRHHANGVNSVRINVYFSYKRKTKEIFYFLKIDDYMIILGKFDKHFVVNDFSYFFFFSFWTIDGVIWSMISISFLHL